MCPVPSFTFAEIIVDYRVMFVIFLNLTPFVKLVRVFDFQRPKVVLRSPILGLFFSFFVFFFSLCLLSCSWGNLVCFTSEEPAFLCWRFCLLIFHASKAFSFQFFSIFPFYSFLFPGFLCFLLSLLRVPKRKWKEICKKRRRRKWNLSPPFIWSFKTLLKTTPVFIQLHWQYNHIERQTLSKFKDFPSINHARWNTVLDFLN